MRVGGFWNNYGVEKMGNLSELYVFEGSKLGKFFRDIGGWGGEIGVGMIRVSSFED